VSEKYMLVQGYPLNSSPNTSLCYSICRAVCISCFKISWNN